MSKVFYNEYDEITGTHYRHDVSKMVKPRKSESDSLLADFEGEQFADILEALFMLLINKGILKDMSEFKDVFEALKLARKLSKKS